VSVLRVENSIIALLTQLFYLLLRIEV